MSVFTDVWLGNTPPVKSRLGNNAWVSVDSYWESTPVANAIWKQVLETETHIIIVLGQFYEAVDLHSLLENGIQYATGKSTSYNDPAGHYIIFIISKQSGDKYVFTNRFGTYHAYWSADVQYKAISTYYIGMARQLIDKKLDWEGISGFMTMGFFPADKTYLEAIRIFSPSSCYVFNRDCNLVETKRYWNWTFDTSATHNIDGQLKDVLADSINYATQGQRVALPLSGGLDSRMLAGIFNDIDRRSYTSAWSFSYGYASDSPEIKIGRQIGKAVNIPFREKVVPNYLFDSMGAIVDSVELFQYVDGTRQACMLPELSADADVVIGGHWGDVWMDDVHLDNDTANPLQSYFEKKIIKKGSSWLLEKVCSSHISTSAAYLKTYFDISIEKYKHLQDADKIIKSYKTDQWSFRWTAASVRMYQAAAMPVLPFYDKRVVDMLMSIPSVDMKGRQYEVSFIKKYFPSLASITWQEYDANLYCYKYFNNRNYLYRAVHKIKRLVKGEPVTRNWELFYLNEEGRKKLEITLRSPALKALVSQKDIETLLAGFYERPTAAKGYAISMLHTFAQFLNILHENE
jgi:asparagine synthase (glutamine-hydrolysing)